MSIVLTSLTLGAVMAVVTGERRAVSLEVWLAGFSTWFAIATMTALFASIPLAPARLAGLFFRRPGQGPGRDNRPRELRYLETLIMRSRDNDRAFAQQLRPRLNALAVHYLPVRYGIDVSLEPDRVTELLGGNAWLIDPAATERSPTLHEIDQLINLLAEEPT